MLKEKRQQTILKFIKARNIGKQEKITELLSNAGFGVTQSSVSRDLDELGVIKVNGFYALPQTGSIGRNLGLYTLTAAGEILIVAKCESGMASAIAVRIDGAKLDEIVGTIAGDDTIFIAVRDHKAQKTVMKKIWEIFEK